MIKILLRFLLLFFIVFFIIQNLLILFPRSQTDILEIRGIIEVCKSYNYYDYTSNSIVKSCIIYAYPKYEYCVENFYPFRKIVTEYYFYQCVGDVDFMMNITDIVFIIIITILTITNLNSYFKYKKLLKQKNIIFNNYVESQTRLGFMWTAIRDYEECNNVNAYKEIEDFWLGYIKK